MLIYPVSTFVHYDTCMADWNKYNFGNLHVGSMGTIIVLSRLIIN